MHVQFIGSGEGEVIHGEEVGKRSLPPRDSKSGPTDDVKCEDDF